MAESQGPMSRQLERKSGLINDLMHRKFVIEADEREVDFEMGRKFSTTRECGKI